MKTRRWIASLVAGVMVVGVSNAVLPGVGLAATVRDSYTERDTERVSERLTERPTERISERVSEHMSEREWKHETVGESVYKPEKPHKPHKPPKPPKPEKPPKPPKHNGPPWFPWPWHGTDGQFENAD